MKKLLFIVAFLLIATWAWGAFIVPKLIPGPRFGADTRMTEETAVPSSGDVILMTNGTDTILLVDGSSQLLRAE